MKMEINSSQKKAISGFFVNIAVAWFVGAFVTPKISPDFDTLTLIRYLANMIGAIVLALFFLKDEL